MCWHLLRMSGEVLRGISVFRDAFLCVGLFCANVLSVLLFLRYWSHVLRKKR